MIFDKIENLRSYCSDWELINKSLNEKFELGRHDVFQSKHFVIGLEYKTQEEEKCMWEAHRRYLDLHIVLEGEEQIRVSDISNMIPANEYVDDYQLFEGRPDQTILLRNGFFLILYPHEVHKTSVQVNSSCFVRKKVYKYFLNE